MPEDRVRKAICSQVVRILKEERIRQGVSLNLLSSRSGLSRQMVSYVEQGERNPTLDTLLRLTGALNVKLEEILSESRKLTSGKKL